MSHIYIFLEKGTYEHEHNGPYLVVTICLLPYKKYSAK